MNFWTNAEPEWDWGPKYRHNMCGQHEIISFSMSRHRRTFGVNLAISDAETQ